MNRRVFLSSTTLGVLAGPRAVTAQQPGRTAKALGLTMPPSLLLRTDEVIE